MVSQKDIQGAIDTYFAANNALDVDGFVDAFAPNASMYNQGHRRLVARMPFGKQRSDS